MTPHPVIRYLFWRYDSAGHVTAYASEPWWEWACFELGYTPYGGSGLGRSLSDLLEMPVDHIIRDLKQLDSRRRWEAEQLKRR